MEVTSHMRKLFNTLGYGESSRNPLLPIFFLVIFIVVGIFNLIAIPKVWKRDVIQRFMAIKDLNVIIKMIGVGLIYWYQPGQISNLLNTADQKYSVFNDKISQNYTDEYIENKKSQKTILDNTRRLIFGMVSVVGSCPLLSTMYLIHFRGIDTDSVNHLPLPYVFWFPEKYDNFKSYLVVYFVEAIMYFVGVLTHIYVMYGTMIIALHAVTTDLKLFNISINEIDSYALDDGSGLESYVRFLIKRHQSIYKSVRDVNKNTGLLVTLGNQCMCFQMCVYLYCTCEIDHIWAKIGYLSVVLMESCVMFVYSFKGQQIINQSDELLRSLAETGWLEKPNWFKKNLILMLTRSNAPLHVKPFGLYILNLNAYSTVMQVAYSYFNMLRTFKDKTVNK